LLFKNKILFITLIVLIIPVNRCLDDTIATEVGLFRKMTVKNVKVDKLSCCRLDTVVERFRLFDFVDSHIMYMDNF
jgi:hypothetical protein